MRPISIIRATLCALGVLAALFGVPWLALVFMIVLALRFASWEALIIGLMVDLLWYGTGTLGGFGPIAVVPFPFFTILAIAIVWLLEPLRNELMR